MTCFFSCCFQDCLFFFDFQQYGYDVFRCESLDLFYLEFDFFWMYTMFFIKFGKILAIISSDMFPTPFSLSPLPAFPICLCLYVLWCPTCSFFFILFPFCSSDWIIYRHFIKFVDSFSLPTPICCSAPIMNSSFQLLYFARIECLFSPFKNF